MLAQVLEFNGPRSAEMLAAADRAGRERLEPIMLAHPRMRDEMVALLVLRQADGREWSIMIVHSQEGLNLAHDLVMSSELLPDEDVTLLPGPDRVDTFEVVSVRGSLTENMVQEGARS